MRTIRRWRARRAPGAVAAGLVLLVAACGDTPAGSGAAAPAPAPAASPPAADAPTEPPPSPAAAPDAGVPGESPETAASTPPGGDAGPPPVTAAERLPEPPLETAGREDLVPAEPELPPEVARVLAAARALRGEGRRADAVRALRDGEAAHGDSAALRLETAWCFFELAEEAFRAGADPFLVKGNLADAHLRLDQAGALQADLPGAAVLLAKVLRYEEDPDRAREVLREHVARFSGDADAHRELGDLATNARDWALADTHWSKAAELDPSDGRSRLQATLAKQWLTAEGGASYTRDELHAGYRTAARLLPDEDDPLRLLVGLWPNEPEERLAALDEVIADNPDAVWARVWKAYLLRSTRPEEALELLAAAHHLQPGSSDVLLNRAEILVELERWTDAVDAYVQALEIGAPGSLTGASDALDALLHLGPQAAAIPLESRDRAYDALCDANPAIGRYGNNAGLWYRDVGKDFDKSLRYYLRSVAAEPEDQDYLNDTALIYLFHLRDRKDACLPMFLKVRRLVEEEGQEPIRGYWDTLENLCKYYFETGQLEKVLECAERRADPAAQLNGRPYPSAKAAAYASQARRKLAETR